MILLTVLVATLVIAVCLPVLGQRVLERRIVFVDLALAQVAATGYALGMAIDVPGVFAAAATTATAVIFMAMMDEETPLPKEAVMGGVYVFAASVGMVLLSLLPYGEGQLMGLLFGSVLGIDWQGIGELALFSGIGLALALPNHANSFSGRIRFYTGLSLIIVPAIYAIGVLLVFAYLVMPALSVWRRGHNGPAWEALTLAAIASIVGTFAADLLDLPPSATVVLTLAVIAVITGTIIHFNNLGPEEAEAPDNEKEEKVEEKPEGILGSEQTK